jgi:hypothetical protein
MSLEKGAFYDFQFCDEITTFQLPFIYFMHSNFLEIISPNTNKIVRTFDFSKELL